jgi:hypothetical protein
MRPTRTVLPALAAVLLTAPAAAHAAALTTDLPCYVEQQPMIVNGSGYAPNAEVQVQGDQIFTTVTTDATGSFSAPLMAPIFPTVTPGSKEYSVGGTESANPASTATAAFRVTNFTFSTSQGQKSPRAKRRWTFSGFQPGQPIYGHFRHGGRTRGTYRFGVAKAPCGEYSKKAPGIAVKGTISAGTWTVQIDQVRKYSSKTRPALKGSTTVFKIFRPR